MNRVEAEFFNGENIPIFTETWALTGALRFYRGSPIEPSHLQQELVCCETGESRWQDVPTVDAPI